MQVSVAEQQGRVAAWALRRCPNLNPPSSVGHADGERACTAQQPPPINPWRHARPAQPVQRDWLAIGFHLQKIADTLWGMVRLAQLRAGYGASWDRSHGDPFNATPLAGGGERVFCHVVDWQDLPRFFNDDHTGITCHAACVHRNSSARGGGDAGLATPRSLLLLGKGQAGGQMCQHSNSGAECRASQDQRGGRGVHGRGGRGPAQHGSDLRRRGRGGGDLASRRRPTVGPPWRPAGRSAGVHSSRRLHVMPDARASRCRARVAEHLHRTISRGAPGVRR